MSTLRTITVQDERLNGGMTTIIPTVWSGKVVSNHDAVEYAVKSNIKWPAFKSDSVAQAADKRYHEFMQYMGGVPYRGE